jgi:hypothetical protein
VTLRYQRTGFAPWPWTYADYREREVLAFLDGARAMLHKRIQASDRTDAEAES